MPRRRSGRGAALRGQASAPAWGLRGLLAAAFFAAPWAVQAAPPAEDGTGTQEAPEGPEESADADAEAGAVRVGTPEPEQSTQAPESLPPRELREIFEIPRGSRNDPYGPRPVDVPRLSREQIGRYALDNPYVEASKARVEAMEAQARKANWAWFPVIQASAFVSPGVSIQCDDVTLQQANGDSFDFQWCRPPNDSSGEPVDVQTVRGYLQQLNQAGIAVRLQADFVVPIYTFGKLKTVKELAAVGVALTKLEVEATRQESLKRVAEAYAGLLLARESIRILDEGWRLLQRERKKMAPKSGAEDWESDLDGDAAQSDPKDFIRLEVGEIEIARRMREARKMEALALSALWTLAGDAAPPGFDIADAQLRPRTLEGGLKPLAHYQELAAENRPEAKAASGFVEVRKKQEKLARRNFLPDLGLAVSARYGWASAAQIEPALYYTGRPNFSSVTVALGLRWNLDFHNKAFELQQAAAERRRADAQREAAGRLLALEVERAYRDYRAAVDDAEFAAMARDKSWQLVVTEQQRSTVGDPDFDELRKALVAWAEYEFEHFEALQAQNVALAKLERATGVVLAASEPSAQRATKAPAAATNSPDSANSSTTLTETAPEG